MGIGGIKKNGQLSLIPGCELVVLTTFQGMAKSTYRLVLLCFAVFCRE